MVYKCIRCLVCLCVFIMCVTLLCVSIPSKDPPTIQQLDPFYYVIAGDTFTLNCTVTDERKSPEEINFLWYKDNHNITSLTKVIVNDSTYTSQLYIEKLDSDQDGGRYMCVAYKSTTNANATSTTTVIVES